MSSQHLEQLAEHLGAAEQDGVFSAGYVGGGANACLDLPKQGLKCFGIGLPMTFSVSK